MNNTKDICSCGAHDNPVVLYEASNGLALEICPICHEMAYHSVHDGIDSFKRVYGLEHNLLLEMAGALASYQSMGRMTP